jgi:hypothetical protein
MSPGPAPSQPCIPGLNPFNPFGMTNCPPGGPPVSASPNLGP